MFEHQTCESWTVQSNFIVLLYIYIYMFFSCWNPATYMFYSLQWYWYWICMYIYIYFYVCILYTYMFYILWIFVFENHDGFRHSVADWSQIGEPQTATLVVAGASLPSTIIIYSTYWYIMYAYIWIHIHEFQRGKSLLQKPRRANKKRNANSKGIVGPRPNHSDEMFEPTFVMIVR